jgi:hypothetical protein
MTIALTLTFDDVWERANLLAVLTGVDYSLGDRCTCCDEERMAIRWGAANEEWMHLDDETYAEMRHLHVDSSSSDCDGRYTRGHVVRLNTGIADWALHPVPKSEPQPTPTWHDLVTYMFRHEAGIWSGPTTIEMDPYAGYMRWHTTTDEGGCAGEVRVCDDPGCAYEDAIYRDHRAESMGY